MKDCLLIMHAREIPQCVSSFKALDVDKVWFKAFTEQGLERPVAKFIEDTRYDNYIMASDDLVANQEALDIVRKGLEKHPVFTGYCNMSPVNLRGSVRFNPIRGNYTFYVLTHMIRQLYPLTEGIRLNSFPPLEKVKKIGGEFRTFFAAMCYTGMRRQLWRDFPFVVYYPPWRTYDPRYGFGSDFMLSDRLNKAGIPIVCDSRAYVYHLASKENMMVGKIAPKIIYEARGKDPVELVELLQPSGQATTAGWDESQVVDLR